MGALLLLVIFSAVAGAVWVYGTPKLNAIIPANITGNKWGGILVTGVGILLTLLVANWVLKLTLGKTV